MVKQRQASRFSNGTAPLTCSVATTIFCSRTDHTACSPANGKLIGQDFTTLVYVCLNADIALPVVEICTHSLTEEATSLYRAYRGPR
ncbi:hypothetical protein COU78_01250 [Candidatus Peregrinibacteria bacterium CG10_big_fil_rev_8_21_14_0_10_49_24]|nr:MAG: hypothetical protein COV83_04215 [Candidatus Peregrinibacteria bacterium CG11_big_fil_rev_8_21_14_0_20_49_14]PIR51353.1 MAG: hypothetical protein COU78_01250 [Candidatus Peregrinibacteria bacterium CG10_big_fil_rev_8_21_14_0_10_49_24]PJA68117.1 MAG: hypothetical protein CO157_01065 [Candidatus Peregrinibacteria bacterium CG_4_9_14_3_um_filter_49_12]